MRTLATIAAIILAVLSGIQLANWQLARQERRLQAKTSHHKIRKAIPVVHEIKRAIAVHRPVTFDDLIPPKHTNPPAYSHRDNSDSDTADAIRMQTMEIEESNRQARQAREDAAEIAQANRKQVDETRREIRNAESDQFTRDLQRQNELSDIQQQEQINSENLRKLNNELNWRH